MPNNSEHVALSFINLDQFGPKFAFCQIDTDRILVVFFAKKVDVNGSSFFVSIYILPICLGRN